MGAIGNVYNYIDAAHHGWIGWGSNFGPTANQLLAAATASGCTVHNVQGFVTNTANYSALQEPYVKITDTVDGQTVRQARWIDWNQYVDELSFAQAFRNKLVSVGFDSTIGMLVDTSRNGAGAAPARPTGPGATTSVDTYVNGGRIDRRIHAGNARNGNNPTGALPNAPISGAWFSAQFQELMRNVYPPIS